MVDNNSSDNTVEQAKASGVTNLKVIENKKNLGFSKANNKGVKASKGKFLLFLNPDVIVKKVNFEELIKFLQESKERAALTVRLELEDGSLDKASHRGFPTLLRSVFYFLGFEKLFCSFPITVLKKIFGGYHMCWENLRKIHEIDSPSGAFFLVKREVFEEVGGFDEDYFMYGEDLDLAYKIKERGYKIFFYPKYKAIHLKYRSGLKSQKKRIRKKTRYYFYQAMKIFFEKHFYKKYPQPISFLVVKYLDIKVKKLKHEIRN